MSNKKVWGVICFLMVLTPSVWAQQVITGKIVDAKTAEPLAAAHVIIKGTYKGTIANADGEFSLKINEFPATIVVRFMGYESQEKVINKGHTGPPDFLMDQAFLEMQEITVTGEDPAISIMKEVIRRKQIWREKLTTYKVGAYTRQQLLKDTSIVSISESISEAFWDKERGNREVLKSKRQTANIDEANNFAGVSYLPNFYDDNLDIVGFDVVGVTHPDALRFYDFELVDFHKIDDEIVFEISVDSKKKLQPLFEGTIFVLDNEYALFSVRLKPNSVVVFPKPVQEFNMFYEQQFSNFGGDFWLPVDFRMEGMIEVGIPGLRFPPIGFSQVSKLNDYKVNVELPDTLFKENNWITVDSTTINKTDSMFVNAIDVVPLSNKEELAYGSLDSTATLEKEFQPTGFLTRFIDMDEESDDTGTTVSVGSSNSGKQKKKTVFDKVKQVLSIDGRYNRVDALYAGLKFEDRYANGRVRLRGKLGYSSGYGAVDHGVNISWWPLPKTRRFVAFTGYSFDTSERYSSDLLKMPIASVMPILGFDDYFDYYRKEGGFLGVGYRPSRSPNSFYLRYRYEEHSSINFKTSYDLLNRDNFQRFNPMIDEGTLSSVELSLTRGEGKESFGIIGADDINIQVEHSAKFLGSSWDFTRFNIDLYRRYNTFYQRRLIPNSLDLRFNAGTYIGDLPVQKNGAIDAALGYFTPFGAFRSKRYIPYEGASFMALNAEHNFRSVPLEALGWSGAAKSGLSVIAFGGIGRTWIPNTQMNTFSQTLGFTPVQTNNWHSEIGVSLSNIFSLFRIDLAYRIDKPGIYPGISVARLF